MKIKSKKFYHKLLLRLSIAVISVIIYYIIFSPFLDNPVEYELKRTNEHLRKEVIELKKNVNLMDSTYTKIKQRDDNIYLSLLNTAPTKKQNIDVHIVDSTNGGLYEDIDMKLLLTILERKTNKLYNSVTDGTVEIDSLERILSSKDVQFAYIPSIQPIDNPHFTKSFVTSGMKLNPFYKGEELHSGFDFAVEEGTRIFATGSGRVKRIGENITNKGGLTIEIDHGNGYMTRYSNLSKTRARRYSRVKKGDIIAYSGNSGYSFMPHLHYEVLYNGKHVAPINFFFADLSMIDYNNIKYRVNESIQSFD